MGFAQVAPGRYALVLEDAPVAARYSPAASLRAAEAAGYRSRIEARQRALRAELASRGIQVTGSAGTLVNAIFVTMPENRVAEARSLAGVAGVVPLRRYKKAMNRAAELVSASAAWANLGGQANGGAGVKIAILDTGIDHTHPSFQDPSLPVPPGYPKCEGADCNFTNNKIIAARSYTRYLAAGTDPGDPAADSRPDDLSPRDGGWLGTGDAKKDPRLLPVYMINAGFAYYGRMNAPDWAAIERIFTLNVFSAVYSAAKMRELNGDRPYRIVITASAMSFLSVPGYALYSATKAALRGFAGAYRYELKEGQKLHMVYPIATRTGFFNAAGEGTPVPWPSQTPETVARAIIRGVARDKNDIFPSRLFHFLNILNGFFPLVHKFIGWFESRKLPAA